MFQVAHTSHRLHRVSHRHVIVIVNQLQINRLLIKKTNKTATECLFNFHWSVGAVCVGPLRWGRFSGSNCSLQVHFRINCYWSLAYWQLNSLGVNLSKHIPTSTAQTPFLTQKLSAYLSQKFRTSFFFHGHDSETDYDVRHSASPSSFKQALKAHPFNPAYN